MKKHFTLLVFVSILLSQSILAQITTIPAGTATSVNVCKNGSVIFQSSTTPPAGASILWTFPTGTPSSATTIGPHAVSFPTSGSHIVSLTIDGVTVNKTVVVGATTAPLPTVNLFSGSALLGYGKLDPPAVDTTEFFYCGNLNGQYNASDVFFEWTVPTNAANTVIINWGDGTPGQSFPGGGTASHLYDFSSPTTYIMHVSVTNAAGNCVSAGYYKIVSTLSPQISISGNLSTLCLPSLYSFVVNTNNIPNTTVTASTNGPGINQTSFTGSPFNVPINIATSTGVVSYLYDNSSCNVTSGQFNNSFSWSVTGTNACGASTSSIAPIYASKAPVSSFTKNPSTGLGCLNQNVVFTKTSGDGQMVSSAGCTNTNKWCWSISPATGWTPNGATTIANFGSCANSNFNTWPNAANAINVAFNIPGTYYITLTQANGCGTSTFTDSICIVEPIIANYTADVVTGCAPLTVNTTNTPYLSTCTDPVYTWIAAAGTPNCPTPSASPTFINGTSNSSFEPELLFSAPGSYELTLIAGFQPAMTGTACANTTHVVNINVGAPPVVTFGNNVACQNVPFSPNATVSQCYSPSTYSWSFPGATSFTGATTANPSVIYPPGGPYTISVTITNACGTGTFETTVTMAAPPTISVTSAITEICLGGTLQPIATVTNAPNSIAWSISPGFTASFAPNAGLSPTATVTSGTGLATITGTTTSTACPNVSQSVNVNVIPAPFVQSTTLNLCSGETLNFAPTNTPPNSVPPGTQYTWTLVPNPFITGASPSATPQSSFSHTLVNNDVVPQTLVYNVLPINSTGVGCPGVPFTITVHVAPQLFFDNPGDLQFCTNVEVDIPLTGFASYFSWNLTNNNTNIGIGTSSGQDSIEFTTSIPLNIETGIFEVIAHYEDGVHTCQTPPTVFNIDVIPNPVTDQLNNFTFCNGALTGITFTSSTPGTNFTWQSTNSVNVGFGAVPNPTSGSFNFTTNNTTNNIITSNIEVIGELAGCIGEPMYFDIAVNPTISITNNSNSQSVCSGSASTQVNWNTNQAQGLSVLRTWSIANSGTTVTGFIQNGTGNMPAFNPLTIPPGSADPGILTVTVIPSVNGCPGTPFTYTITVHPIPILSPIAPQTICGGGAIVPPTLTSTANNTSYSYTLISTGIPPQITGYPTSGTGNVPGNVISNPTVLPFTFVYEITPNVAGCPGTPQNFSVTVNPSPTVVPSVLSQEICSGESTLPVTFSTATPNATISWNLTSISPSPSDITGLNPLPSGNGSTPIPGNPLLINLTNPISQVVATYEAVATTSGALVCPGIPYTYTLTINPKPTVLPFNDLLVCEGSNVGPLNFLGSGNGYYWTGGAAVGLANHNTGAGLNSPSFTALNAGNSPLSETVTVTAVYTGSQTACPGDDFTEFTITVNPMGEITPISDFTVCNNTNMATIPFVPTNTGGANTYNWTGCCASIGSHLNGGNGSSIPAGTVSTGTLATQDISIIPTFTSSGLSCPGPAEEFSITVIPTPVVNQMPNENYCHGISIPPMPYSGVATSYNWQHTDGSIGSPNVPLSGNGQGFPGYISNNPPGSIPPQKTSNVTVIPEYTENNVTCTGNAMNYSITINSSATVNQVSNIVVCHGEVVNAITFTGLASTFDWLISGPNTGWTLPSGSSTFPSFVANNTTSAQLVNTVTVTPTYSFLGLICTGVEMQFTITVNPIPTLNPISDLTICSQVNQPAINFSGTGTGVQWASVSNAPIVVATSNTTFNVFGNNSIPGFVSLNTPVDLFNTFNVTPIYDGSGLICSGTTVQFTINVLQRPVVNPIADTAICNLECIPAFTIQGTGNNYTWNISGASNISLTSPGSGQIFGPICGNNSTTSATTSTVNITPQYTMNGVTCTGPIDQFLVVVNPTPNVTPIPNITVCDGFVQVPINITGTASPTTYHWAVTDNPGVFGGITSINGSGTIPTFVATNVALPGSASIGQITITPEYTGPGLSCPGAPFVWTVTVNPIPQVDPISNQTICLGTTTTPVVFTGTGNSYNWNAAPTIGNLASQNNVLAFPSFTGTNPGNTPLCNTFNVTPVFTTNNVSCFGTISTFDICVLPNPQITQVAPVSICNNTTSAAVNYTGTFTENTLSVAVPGLLLNSPAPPTGNLPVLSWTNSSTTTHLTGVVTASPSYTFNGLTCQGSPMSHNINVLPTTLVTAVPPNSVYCNGDAIPQIPFSTSGNGVFWAAAPNVGLTSGTTGFTPATTAINTDTSPSAPAVVSTVTITPTYTLATPAPSLTCNGTPSAFTITVNPTPVITEIADYTICNYGAVDQTLTTNIPSNFNWTSTTTTPSFVAGNTTSTIGNNHIFDGVLVNNSLPFPGFPVIVTYTGNAVSLQGCTAAPMSFDVTLMPDILMTSSTSHQVCSGNVVNFLFESNVPSTYNWYALENQLVNGESTVNPLPSSFIDDILTIPPPTNVNQIVIYTVTPTSINGNCPGAPQNVLVTVTPPPALVSPASIAMCSGQPVNYTFVANTSANFTYFGVPTVGVTGVNATTTQGATITDVLINNTGGPITVSYWVVISSNIPGVACTSQPIEIFITVNPLPQMLPITQEICPGGTVNYTLVATQQSGFSWYADQNLNVSGETTVLQNTNFIINTLNHNMPDAQYVYYNITPTATATGCVGPTIQHIAIVHPIPDLSFTMSPYLCTENEVTYTIAPTTPLNVIWELGNGQQSTSYTPSTYYDQPGNYVITLYGINPVTGCFALTYTPITILLAPPVDFITSSTQECVPAFFQFTNTAQNQGSVLTWNFGDGTTSNEQLVADHFYQQAGCYDVSLTAVAQNGCPNTRTYEDMVCAYNIPIAGFIVNDPIQYGDVNEFMFENLTVFGYTYFWDLGDGTTTNAVHPGHIYPMERNTYNVTLIATNEAGCSDTTMYTIQVQERLIFYIPNSFTPDGNTRNETFQPVFTSGYDIYTYELMIFNRWGEPMFESLNDKVGWDGTYGGKIMEAGTYTWRVRFRLLDDDDITEYFGHVNLLR